MRFARTFVPAFLSLALTVFFALPARPSGQTVNSAPQTSPHAVTLLQQSLAALTGGKSITDVTLSGTARRIAGSDDESGTATLKALTTGETRVDLVFASGTRTELRTFPNSGPAGSWVSPDGVAHPISQHNLLTHPSWFFPAITVARMASAGYAVTYVGHETIGVQAVEHIYATRQFQAVGAPANWTPAPLQKLAGMDIFLDAASLLPTSISFNVHPDNDVLRDIPVTIRLSDYRTVGGVQIPFHIQKFFNNSLDIDLQLQTSSINSGLSASSFSVQ